MPINQPALITSTFKGINNKADPEGISTHWFSVANNVYIDSNGDLFSRHGRTALNSTAYLGAYATFDKSRAYAITGSGDLQNWSTNAATVLRSGFIGYPYWLQIADVVFVGNENQCWRIGPDSQVQDNALVQPASLQLSLVAGTLPAGQYRFVQVTVAANGRESAPSIESIITVDGTQNIQLSGITGQRIYACPANSKVFGHWRDTASSTLVYAATAEQLDEELRTLNLQPMQCGRCLAAYQGRLYCSIYDSRTNTSAIYRSVPLWWDLMDPVQDMILIAGEVRAMAGLDSGLIICTDRQIIQRVDDQNTNLTDYGVPPGQAISFDERIPGSPTAPSAGLACWIWSQRGLCKAFPFTEVTPQFAAADSNFVGSCIFRRDGDVQFVAAVSPFGPADAI